MMFKKFKFLTAAFLMLSCVCVSSCSDDNDGPKGDGSKDNAASAVNPKTVYPYGVPKEIKRTTSGSQWTYTITTDDQGLVTKIYSTEGKIGTYTFDYAPDKSVKIVDGFDVPSDYDITMTFPRETNGYFPEYYYFKLNKDGYIEKAYKHWYERNGKYTAEYSFKYNKDGRVTEIKREPTYDVYGEPNYFYFTYNDDGDLIHSKSSVSGIEDEFTFSYTNTSYRSGIKNKSGIRLLNIYLGLHAYVELKLADFAGLLGKASAHLPLAQEIPSSGYQPFTLKWELDQDGMPYSANEDILGSYSFEW